MNGTGGGCFSPGGSMSRGDFMLMVCRAFELGALRIRYFSPMSPQEAIIMGRSRPPRRSAIAQGSDGKFSSRFLHLQTGRHGHPAQSPGNPGESPAAGAASDLAAFSDAAELSPNAQDAAAALVRDGHRHRSGGALHPKDMLRPRGNGADALSSAHARVKRGDGDRRYLQLC